MGTSKLSSVWEVASQSLPSDASIPKPPYTCEVPITKAPPVDRNPPSSLLAF